MSTIHRTPLKSVGPNLQKKKSKFLVYKQYFPNQNASNFVRPIEEFSGNFRRYGGISTDVSSKVFSGKNSSNRVLTKTTEMLDSHLPVPENTLIEVGNILEKAQAVAREKYPAFSIAPLLEYLMRFLIVPSNTTDMIKDEMDRAIYALYPNPNSHQIVREAFYEAFKNVADSKGEPFDFVSNIPSKETLIQLLQSMFYINRLPIEAKLNQNQRWRIEKYAMDAAEIVGIHQMKLQSLIKLKRERAYLKHSLMNFFRLKMDKYQTMYNESSVFAENWLQKHKDVIMGVIFGATGSMQAATSGMNTTRDAAYNIFRSSVIRQMLNMRQAVQNVGANVGIPIPLPPLPVPAPRGGVGVFARPPVGAPRAGPPVVPPAPPAVPPAVPPAGAPPAPRPANVGRINIPQELQANLDAIYNRGGPVAPNIRNENLERAPPQAAANLPEEIQQIERNDDRIRELTERMNDLQTGLADTQATIRNHQQYVQDLEQTNRELLTLQAQNIGITRAMQETQNGIRDLQQSLDGMGLNYMTYERSLNDLYLRIDSLFNSHQTTRSDYQAHISELTNQVQSSIDKINTLSSQLESYSNKQALLTEQVGIIMDREPQTETVEFIKGIDERTDVPKPGEPIEAADLIRNPPRNTPPKKRRRLDNNNNRYAEIFQTVFSDTGPIDFNSKPSPSRGFDPNTPGPSRRIGPNTSRPLTEMNATWEFLEELEDYLKNKRPSFMGRLPTSS